MEKQVYTCLFPSPKAAVKKIQDYYFKKAKKEGYPARSVYKLEEAQQKHRLLKKGDRVLDLGCQPGSWSIYAAKTIGPQGQLVGIDLTGGGIGRHQDSAEIRCLTGDIMADESLIQLRAISERYDVILSDMAPKTTGHKWADQQHSLDLARRVLQVCTELLMPGGNMYCKVFEGEDFKDFVVSVQHCFKKVKIVKPKSSRSESREVFVLGMDFVKKDG
jgi:23S rRNA (uridine2552-2'-O)-methyltransferase